MPASQPCKAGTTFFFFFFNSLPVNSLSVERDVELQGAGLRGGSGACPVPMDEHDVSPGQTPLGL